MTDQEWDHPTLTKKEFMDRLRLLAAETDSPSGSIWWLSFADVDLPAGQQFLGVCLVAAPNLSAAIFRSHLLGINPGGEVQITGPLDSVPPNYPLDKLLSARDINALDAEGTY